MKKHWRLEDMFVAAIIFVAWIAASVESSAQGNPKSVIDLRPTMAQMKLKEGANLISKQNGVRLSAQVEGGRIVGWSAVDGAGKSLPTKLEAKGPVCRLCVETGTGWICNIVDCRAKPPRPKKAS